MKTISAYTKNTNFSFIVFLKNIHLVTQSFSIANSGGGGPSCIILNTTNTNLKMHWLFYTAYLYLHIWKCGQSWETAGASVHKEELIWTEAKFLDEIQTKVLRVFLLAKHSHLYSFALRFLFLQTHATSYSCYSSVTVQYTVKEKGGKHGRKPGIFYLGDKPHSPNLSDLAECVILCTSWLQSPGKVYCRAVNIWVTLVELRFFLPKQDTSSPFTVLKSCSAEILFTWHQRTQCTKYKR